MSRGHNALLQAALRERAGRIGLLECCRCTYPTEIHATETEHAETCPSHGMTLSARAAQAASTSTPRVEGTAPIALSHESKET